MFFIYNLQSIKNCIANFHQEIKLYIKTYVKSVHIKNKICLYTFKPVIRIKIISKINKKSIKSINRSIKSINVKK